MGKNDMSEDGEAQTLADAIVKLWSEHVTGHSLMDALRGEDMRRRGFTLVELVVGIAILLLIISLALSSCGWIAGGCSGGQGSLLVNPWHDSQAKIQVIRSYAMSATDEVSGNVYRIFAKVLEDSDGNTGEETFEVRDSYLDGNMMSADLFGKLVDNGIFIVDCRGERSGVRSSFRGITAVEKVEE